MNLDLKKNLNKEERLIRVVIGLLLLNIAFKEITPKHQSTFYKVFSSLLFIDSIFGYCFLNDLMGWNSKKRKCSIIKKVLSWKIIIILNPWTSMKLLNKTNPKRTEKEEKNIYQKTKQQFLMYIEKRDPDKSIYKWNCFIWLYNPDV